MAIIKTSKPRKSLKQSLKEILSRRFRQSPLESLESVGSGILRREVYSSLQLHPNVNISSFAEQTVTEFGFNEDVDPIPNIFEKPSREALTTYPSYHSLLPATSLSQFDLRQAYLQQAPSAQQVLYDSVPDQYGYGHSRHASLATVRSVVPRPSISSLKIQKSSYDLSNRKDSGPKYIRPRSNRQRGLTYGAEKQPCRLRSPSPQQIEDHLSRVALSQHPEWSDSGHDSKYGIEHFRLFCVLDTASAGCPVTATSQELRYIFDIGERFFLNNKTCEGTSMDVVTGYDAASEPVTHLVLFSPLISPASGRSRFMLASLIDVTQFIRDTAELPDLQTITEESNIESDMHSPRCNEPIIDWTTTSRLELSAEDLLGGCFMAEENSSGSMAKSFHEDVWLNLATEEQSRRSNRGLDSPRTSSRSRSRTPTSHFSSTATRTTMSSTVDDAIDDFMSSLRELYSDFFLLGKSPLDDDFYEICNVSPRVYASKEYIDGHLRHTPKDLIMELSERLSGDLSFHINVKWGVQGLEKRLYCNPLFGQRSVTWLCFLVDKTTAEVW